MGIIKTYFIKKVNLLELGLFWAPNLFSLKKMSRFQINIGLCNSIPDNFLNYWEFNISSKDINLIIKTINKKAIHQICLIRHALGEMFCVGIEGVSDYTVLNA